MSHAQDDYDHLREDADAARLAEVWCERCPLPSVRMVRTNTGDHYLCDEHARLLDFQINSRNFNGGRR